MISIEEQQKLFIAISRELKRSITAYAIGGTAMMFLGLKEATLDVDLVFENEQDKNTFKNAAKSLGYAEMDSVKVYGEKTNRPDMLMLGDSRLDLFVDNIVSFVFSREMKKRANQIHQFGDKLILRISDPHDLILMKCATDRIKDKDDARRILESKTIDFDCIIREAENQIVLGKERALFELGCFLEALKKIIDKKIPQSIIEKLFKLVKKQVASKSK